MGVPDQHNNLREILRKKRSSVLHQMQLLDVDTADWSKVDALCMDSRIAGKRFCRLDCDELDALLKKLRAIRRKQTTLKISDMRKETREAIGSLKTQMLEAAATLTSEEREEFYNEVNEWTYEQYEDALLCQEAEMQSYDEED